MPWLVAEATATRRVVKIAERYMVSVQVSTRWGRGMDGCKNGSDGGDQKKSELMQKSVDTGWDQALRGYEQYEESCESRVSSLSRGRRCDSVRNNNSQKTLSGVMSSIRNSVLPNRISHNCSHAPRFWLWLASALIPSML